LEQSTYKKFLLEKIDHLKELQQENREQLDKLYMIIGRTIAETGGLSAFPALRDKYSLLAERDVSLSDDIKQAEDSIYQIEVTEKLSCVKCGFINNRGAEFCQKCGTKLGINSVRTCLKCGAINSVSFRFCADCGSSLGDMPAVIQPSKVDSSVCPSCGKQVSPDKKFCMFCGTRLNVEPPVTVSPILTSSESQTSLTDEVKKQDAPTIEKEPVFKSKKLLTCLVCGKSAPEDQKFCMNCGTRFNVVSSDSIPISDKKAPTVSDPASVPPVKPESTDSTVSEKQLPVADSPATQSEKSEKAPEAPVLKVCPVCGASLSEGQSVCKICGTDFNQGPEVFTKKESRFKSRKKVSVKKGVTDDEKIKEPVYSSEADVVDSSKTPVIPIVSIAPDIVTKEPPAVPVIPDTVKEEPTSVLDDGKDESAASPIVPKFEKEEPATIPNIPDIVSNKAPVTAPSLIGSQDSLESVITKEKTSPVDTIPEIPSTVSPKSENKESSVSEPKTKPSILDTLIFKTHTAPVGSGDQKRSLDTVLESPATVSLFTAADFEVPDETVPEPVPEPVNENLCPECGAVCKPGRSFCVMCGTRIEKK